MAYTTPVAADLKARFPAFATVDNSVVDVHLDEAYWAADDDESVWASEVDFKLARMLVACHSMSMEGHGNTEAGGLMAGFQRIRSGRVALDRGNSGIKPDDLGTLKSSVYGQRYLELLKRAVPAVLVVKGEHSSIADEV